MALRFDVSGIHEGTMAEISYGYPFNVGRWMITPEVKVQWASEEVHQYYFGVTCAGCHSGPSLVHTGLRHEL